MKKITKYQKLAENIAEQIRNHLYQPEDKLPSLRQQSIKHKVSIATVQEAYDRLESWGMIEARPQSGFYVKPFVLSDPDEHHVPLEVADPAQVSISRMATQLFRVGQQAGFVDLGTAYPDASFLPIKSLQRITAQVSRQHINTIARAHFAPGDDELRRQIARRMAETGCHVHADEVVVTNGCQEALSLSLRAIAGPGDTIAIESPTFVGILQAIEALGMKALEIPSHPKEGISIKALELAMDQWDIKGCALIPSFNNPSGSCMSVERRMELANLIEKRNIPVIEDALFEDLSHQGTPLPSLKALTQSDKVLYCSSVSKSLAPGVRIGWVAPGIYQERIEFLKSFLTVGGSALDSMITAEFFRTGNYARQLRSMQLAFANQVNVFSAAISEYFPTGTSISRPRGGYVLWVGLANRVNAWQFYQAALMKKIAVVPGDLFSATDKFQSFIRINCAKPWNETTRQALRELGILAHRMAEQ